MIKIPLQKYAVLKYPKTSGSTIQRWIKLAEKGKGPFAFKIEKIVGRWYISLDDSGAEMTCVAAADNVVEGIKEKLGW